MSKNPLCFLPSFPQSLKSAVNKEQFNVLNYFEHYPLYNFKSSMSLPTPYSVIYLNQTHFNYGTVRIRTPGFYVLTEDIVFEPNKRNNFFPLIYSCLIYYLNM